MGINLNEWEKVDWAIIEALVEHHADNEVEILVISSFIAGMQLGRALAFEDSSIGNDMGAE